MTLSRRNTFSLLALFISAFFATSSFGAVGAKSEEKTPWEKFDEKVHFFHSSEFTTGGFDGFSRGFVPAPDSTPGASGGSDANHGSFDPVTGEFNGGQAPNIFNLEGLIFQLNPDMQIHAWAMWLMNLPTPASGITPAGATNAVLLNPRLMFRHNNLADWFNVGRYEFWVQPGISPRAIENSLIMTLGTGTRWAKQWRFADSFGGAFTFTQQFGMRFNVQIGGAPQPFRFDSLTQINWNMTKWMRTVHRFGFREGFDIDKASGLGAFNTANGYNGTFPILQNGLEIDVTSWLTIAPLINSYAFVVPTTSNVFGTLEVSVAPF
jgi:hypothetical protein